jgi:hypothetical protein
VSTVISFVFAIITGWGVWANHGPSWAAVGSGLVVLHVWLASDRVVHAIRSNRAPSGGAK